LNAVSLERKLIGAFTVACAALLIATLDGVLSRAAVISHTSDAQVVLEFARRMSAWEEALAFEGAHSIPSAQRSKATAQVSPDLLAARKAFNEANRELSEVASKLPEHLAAYATATVTSVAEIGEQRSSVDGGVQYIDRAIDAALARSAALAGEVANARFSSAMYSIASITKAVVLSTREARGYQWLSADDVNRAAAVAALQNNLQDQRRILSATGWIQNDQGIAAASIRAGLGVLRKRPSFTAIAKQRQRVRDYAQLQQGVERLATLLGFGGMIHSFKNLVLRGGDDNLRKVHEAATRAQKVCGDLRLLAAADIDAIKALGVISSLAERYYAFADRVVQLRQAGVGPRGIDAAVRIDDGPALVALELLKDPLRGGNPSVLRISALDFAQGLGELSEAMFAAVADEITQTSDGAWRPLWLFVCCALGAVIIVLVLAVALVGRMRRLGVVSDKIHELATGNYSFGGLPVSGHDEIARLQDAYNHLVSALGQLVARGDHLLSGALDLKAAREVLGSGGSLDELVSGNDSGQRSIANHGMFATVYNNVEVLQVRLALQAEAVAHDDLYSPILDTSLPGVLGETFRMMRGTLHQMAQRAGAIAKEDFTGDACGPENPANGDDNESRDYDRAGRAGALNAAFCAIVDSQTLLARKIETISQGDLGADVLSAGNADGPLSEAFASMVDSLDGMVRGLRMASAQVGAASQSIAAGSEATKSGVENQSDRTAEAASAVLELSASIQEVAQSAKRAEVLSEAGRITASEGGNSVCATIEAMHEVAGTVENTAASLDELTKVSREIGVIVETIADIAAQTNMLALNAAIEAARAGEQGRGFAVVADQVGKLAERSARSAGEVSQLLEGIQTAANQSVLGMTGTLKVVRKASHTADESSVAIEGIVKTVDQMAMAVREISIATSQQAGAADGASAGIEAVNQVSQHSSEAVSKMADQAQELAVVAQELEAVVNEFKVS